MKSKIAEKVNTMSSQFLFWVRRVAAVLIFLVTTIAALAAGLITPYLFAARTANISLLTISALVSFALLTCVGTKFALHCWGDDKKGLTFAISALLTVIFLGCLYILVLRPSGSHFAEAIPYANTKYWQLPTGSRIAYSEFDPPEGVAVKPEAIVYVHGGPGVRQGPFDQDIYGSSGLCSRNSLSIVCLSEVSGREHRASHSLGLRSRACEIRCQA